MRRPLNSEQGQHALRTAGRRAPGDGAEALWAALEDFVRRTALAVDVATADAQRFHATASAVRCTD